MIFAGTSENIDKAATLLKDGGLVAFPTETVYGLGASIYDTKAIARIFEAKSRPSFDPLITHIADFDSLKTLTSISDKRFFDLAEEFWPGSLTMIVPKNPVVPDLVTSGLKTMAIRMPDHPIALDLIRKSTGALAAPSANPFGYLSPTSAQHVEQGLGNKVDMILDGGSSLIGVESTVLDLTRDKAIILRPGGITKEAIEDVIGPVDLFDRTIVTSDAQSGNTVPSAPGQLEMHYSPSKELHIVDKIQDIPETPGTGVLAFLPNDQLKSYGGYEYLSKTGDLIEAASRLFEVLHILDSNPGVKSIYVERVPTHGIGLAIMDRIYKASKK